MSYLESANQILPIFDALIRYSKELVLYLTPQYKTASNALREITDIVYTDISRLIQWQVKLRNFDFSGAGSKEKFLAFKQDMELFKNTPEYHAFEGDCQKMQEIYSAHLQPDLKRIFTRNRAKLEEADRVFEALGRTDDSMGGLAYFLFRSTEDAVEKINKNFQDAENIKQALQDEIGPIRQTLERQERELDELRTKFQKLSSGQTLS
jgi:Xaa-Pro aminopeptidase